MACQSNTEGVNFVVPESAGSDAKVIIYGISGNIVRTITANNSTYLEWNGLYDNEQRAKPGVYLYNILVQGESLATGTVTLMQ